jgi:hypothetical protein
MVRCCLFILAALLVALSAADKTSTFQGVVLAGQSSVAIPYGVPVPGHGLVINTNANFSHSVMTTLEPRLAYSVWSATSKNWESTWTATYCDVGQNQKEVNIIFACYSHGAGAKCLSDVAYYITVTEYNATLNLWNPDQGALRWSTVLGGTGTSLTWNISLNDDNSKLLDSRSDLHFTILTASALPSSAAASLYSFSSKDKDWQSCNLGDVKQEDHATFSGSSSLFLGKTSLSASRQYILVLNGTEPRATYWIIAHVTPGLKRAANIWVFVAVAIACFIVGAILTGICSSFFWSHGREDRESREPLIR